MDETQRACLHKELDEEQERLTYLKSLLIAEPLADMADSASRQEATTFAEALVERSARRVTALRDLLREGGSTERFCEECGCVIPLARILAAPECVCCCACQSRREGEDPF